MAKRKILFITPSLCQGGIEHSQIMMLKLLNKEKFDITLFLYLDDLTLLPLVPEHVKVVIDHDANHYFRRPKAMTLSIMKALCSAFGKKELEKKYAEQLRTYIHEEKMKHPAKDIFSREKFDVVVSNAIGKPTEMAIHINAKKRYVFFHSSVDLHHELLERLFPLYDGIIAVSDGVKTMLQNAYPTVKEKVLLLENFIDADEIVRKAGTKVPEDESNIIRLTSCGRFSLEKGFDLAVQTAALLKEKGYFFKWTFIGDGPERGKIETLIKEHDLEENIRITGYCDNPFAMMKGCDIYVQPSYEESYGRTIKEALILGCPVVSTATVGGKTLIEDGKTGVLTEINAKSLAAGIISLTENKELRASYRNSYSIEQNLGERKTFVETLEALLS